MSFFFPADTTPEEKRRIRAWQLYDWANSVFSTIIITACLPIFFNHVALAGHKEGGAARGTVLWSLATGIAMTIVAVAALILGPISDATARKKRFLGIFAATGCVCTALLAFCPPGAWLAVTLLFILGNSAYNAANIFYDSLLPAVAKPRDLHHVSSGSFALGYLGGGLMLGVSLALIFGLPKQIIPQTGNEFPLLAMRISFLAAAAWWALFAVPLFRQVPEPAADGSNLSAALHTGLGRLVETFRSLGGEKETLKFLIAFWLYSDGFGTIIKVATVYGAEIFEPKGIDPTQKMITAFLMIQFIGVPFTLLWAKLASRIGAKTCVMICLGIYAVICVFAYYMTEIWQFFVLGGAVGLVQGGTQALSRSLFASLLPKGKEAQYFGLYNISGKFAGILGPFIFALVGYFAGSSRLAILAIIVFFVVGGAMLATVKFPEPGEKAQTL